MSYDTIIIGGGINALTSACVLKKSGKRVAIVCPEPELAGLCAQHEFHPGFKSPGVLNDTSMFRPWIIDDLNLSAQGLKKAAEFKTLALGNNEQVMLSNNINTVCQSLQSVSSQDVESFKKMKAFYQKIHGPISTFFNSQPANLIDPKGGDLWSLLKNGFQLRKLGKKDMLEVLRLAPMAIYDWLDEWFQNNTLKAALALPAVTESYSAPWAAGTNANLLIHEINRHSGVEGDGLALTEALIKTAKSLGVQFEHNSAMKRVLVGKGVELENGDVIQAKTTLAACALKKVFLEMMDRNELSHKFEQHIQTFRTRGLASQLLLALDKTPELANTSGAHRFILADNLDEIEKAFDPIKYNELPEKPVLEVYLPTKHHQRLAPSGQAVLSITIHYTPYDLKGGWSESVKEDLANKVIDLVESKIPGIKASVLGKELLSPQDIEARYGISGGHLYEGEHALDQLLIRPSPECSQYKTPYQGLYLCSGGTFPGGGLTGAPGALAAQKVLADN